VAAKHEHHSKQSSPSCTLSLLGQLLPILPSEERSNVYFRGVPAIYPLPNLSTTFFGLIPVPLILCSGILVTLCATPTHDTSTFGDTLNLHTRTVQPKETAAWRKCPGLTVEYAARRRTKTQTVECFAIVGLYKLVLRCCLAVLYKYTIPSEPPPMYAMSAAPLDTVMRTRFDFVLSKL
jgi:hypothetical protein